MPPPRSPSPIKGEGMEDARRGALGRAAAQESWREGAGVLAPDRRGWDGVRAGPGGEFGCLRRRCTGAWGRIRRGRGDERVRSWTARADGPSAAGARLRPSDLGEKHHCPTPPRRAIITDPHGLGQSPPSPSPNSREHTPTVRQLHIREDPRPFWQRQFPLLINSRTHCKDEPAAHPPREAVKHLD